MKKLRSLRVHAEEKGHWIVAAGYLSAATFWGGHNSTLLAMAYGLAALLATHHSASACPINDAEKGDQS